MAADSNAPKSPVRLRQRALKSGRATLYLDIYIKGQRTYETLGLYLEPETSREAKAANRETLRLAEAMQAQRLLEVRRAVHGPIVAQPADVPFFDYFARRAARYTGSSRSVWGIVLRLLRAYEPNHDIPLRGVTAEWVRGFAEALSRGHLRPNSQRLYLSKLRAALNAAVRDGLLPANPFPAAAMPREEETDRAYLTLDELRALAATPCPHEPLRAPFLFACLTGLRHGDVCRLAWGDVTADGGFTRLTFRQQKTKALEHLDLAPQAAALMGARRGDADPVFPNAPSSWKAAEKLREWGRDAGIRKDFTFHAARHTFAVLMLSLGVDLYTVSKLLGHRDIATTQIYARILDRQKREAVGRIPEIPI